MRRVALGLLLSTALVHAQETGDVRRVTLDECVKLLQNAEQPVSLACPGSEVTVCWGSQDVDKVKVTVSPDPEGQSGEYAKQGVLYLRPTDNTTVRLAGSCFSTTKQIQIINSPTPAEFDASWSGECTSLSYALDPNFVDPLILATDVTARWEPEVVDSTGHTTVCATPPFLNGTHTNPGSPIFGFSIPKPNVKQTFTHPQPGVTNWGYTLQACAGRGFKCNQKAAEPFEMTLMCPGQ